MVISVSAEFALQLADTEITTLPPQILCVGLPRTAVCEFYGIVSKGQTEKIAHPTLTDVLLFRFG